MGRIRSYDLLEEFKGDETFVVETDEGTKSLSVGAIKAHITTAVEEKADMLNQNDIEVASDTDSEYSLTITVGAKTVTTPNLKGRSIKSIDVVAGHLMIYFVDETSIDLGVIDGSVPIYGVCRDIPSHSPELKRTGDAVDLIAEVGKGEIDEKIRNDFDSIYPWSEIKRCTLADDGTVTSYRGDPDYTENGSKGQVMVEIPKFYLAHYFDESGAKEYWSISKEKINNKYRLPKPFIAKDGTELDKIYIAAFKTTNEASGMLDSRGGDFYSGTFTYANAIEFAKARGKNWHHFDLAELTDVIYPLFIIEFATLNSQSVFYGNCVYSKYPSEDNVYICENHCWGDWTDETESIVDNGFYFCADNVNCEYFVGQEINIKTTEEYATGELDYKDGDNSVATRKIVDIEVVHTDEDGNEYCYLIFDGDPVLLDAETATFSLNMDRNGITNSVLESASSGSLKAVEGNCEFVYRGIENLYGEYTWVAGAFAKDAKYYVTDNFDAYGTVLTDDYKALSYDAIGKSGYITKFGYDNDMSWALLPTEGGGSSETDFCDNFANRGVSTLRSIRFGGGTALSCGLFSFYCNMPTTNSSSSCARLSYRSYQ